MLSAHAVDPTRPIPRRRSQARLTISPRSQKSRLLHLAATTFRIHDTERRRTTACHCSPIRCAVAKPLRARVIFFANFCAANLLPEVFTSPSGEIVDNTQHFAQEMGEVFSLIWIEAQKSLFCAIEMRSSCRVPEGNPCRGCTANPGQHRRSQHVSPSAFSLRSLFERTRASPKSFVTKPEPSLHACVVRRTGTLSPRAVTRIERRRLHKILST